MWLLFIWFRTGNSGRCCSMQQESFLFYKAGNFLIHQETNKLYMTVTNVAEFRLI